MGDREGRLDEGEGGGGGEMEKGKEFPTTPSEK